MTRRLVPIPLLIKTSKTYLNPNLKNLSEILTEEFCYLNVMNLQPHDLALVEQQRQCYVFTLKMFSFKSFYSCAMFTCGAHCPETALEMT